MTRQGQQHHRHSWSCHLQAELQRLEAPCIYGMHCLHAGSARGTAHAAALTQAVGNEPEMSLPLTSRAEVRWNPDAQVAGSEPLNLHRVRWTSGWVGVSVGSCQWHPAVWLAFATVRPPAVAAAWRMARAGAARGCPAHMLSCSPSSSSAAKQPSMQPGRGPCRELAPRFKCSRRRQAPLRNQACGRAPAGHVRTDAVRWSGTAATGSCACSTWRALSHMQPLPCASLTNAAEPAAHLAVHCSRGRASAAWAGPPSWPAGCPPLHSR